MNIYKNFLPKKVFQTLKNNMMGDYFPWYFHHFINDKNDKKTNFQFTFIFIRDGNEKCWGKWLDIIKPVLKNIKHKKMNRVKANLLTRTDKIIQHRYHTDQDKGTTGILYLNNCNGYTKFENGKKIISEENKYVEFDSSLRHTGSSCTDEQRRVVINFNYEYI
tara:strand:+ start:14 stop:502 length:489 start_codon:yes stop_codon:yes gene_type:complete